MTDAAYRNAEKQRDDLLKAIGEHQAAIEEARKTLSRTEAFLREWRVFAGVEEEEEPPPLHTEPKRVRVRLRDNPPKEKVGDAVEQLLKMYGRPISRDVLFEMLSDGGIQIQGKDPKMILSTMLWRMPDRFVRLPGHGYWWKNHAYAPANYDPDAPASQLRLISDEAALPS